jgi:hypothetical protein
MNKHFHIFTYKDNIHFLELHTLGRIKGFEFVDNDDDKYLDRILMDMISKFSDEQFLVTKLTILQDIDDYNLFMILSKIKKHDLITLELVNCRRLSDLGLSYLRDLTQLQNLKLIYCNNRKITDVGLSHLMALIKLKTLFIDEYIVFSKYNYIIIQNLQLLPLEIFIKRQFSLTKEYYNINEITEEERFDLMKRIEYEEYQQDMEDERRVRRGRK